MKTGVILYVIGSKDNMAHIETERIKKELKLGVDRIEVVTSGSPNFDVMDAWWKLTAQGMGKIVCLMAEMTKNSQIRLMGRELRLCG